MRRAVLLLVLLATRGWGAAGVSVSSDFVSEYVFRGATQRQGASIQTAITYHLVESLRATLWTNLRLQNSIALSETDYSLSWTWHNASPAALSLGGVYYDRSGRMPAPKTFELYAGVDFKVPGNPALYLWWDVDRNVGAYWQLTAGHSFLLPDRYSTVDVGGSLGLDTGRINSFQDARLSIGFTRVIGDWRLRPSVDLHFPVELADPNAHSFRPVFRFGASRTF